ncbi:hypothetical protein TraAM80_01306 [Trypanosoma rangeli]|uniref:Uncharacterized protein n=1 Tax=Trypanosoma rangeli TaxID=5698 RepID=A0A3R7P0J2_TRYRA|nr:uncharacterized protein TraAM80_01306 [Trypanosoma rangeli]RNF10745.1 hypothetical protein TraAM80_01306 [Trypanosoma rangeli]|eukprot:RNF10745.1 hypothetical protein TraAM80_01306 [Trypanosoma rangeli]
MQCIQRRCETHLASRIQTHRCERQRRAEVVRFDFGTQQGRYNAQPRLSRVAQREPGVAFAARRQQSTVPCSEEPDPPMQVLIRVAVGSILHFQRRLLLLQRRWRRVRFLHTWRAASLRRGTCHGSPDTSRAHESRS